MNRTQMTLSVKGMVLALALGWVFGTALSVSQAQAEDVFNAETVPAAQSASLPYVREADSILLPPVLSAADAERYRRLFEMHERGDWKAADKLIQKLDDKVLLGHVMAARYLHPTKYRSRYKELKAWMGDYADHPQAGRLYKLALSRRPANWRYPDRPIVPSGSLPVIAEDLEPDDVRPRMPRRALGTAARREVYSLKRQMRRQLGRGLTLAVKRTLESQRVKRLFSSAEWDEYAAMLGLKYFSAGRDQWAYDWASKAANRSGKYVPEAHWAAGLAAWRLGMFDQAADHFISMADQPGLDPWFESSGAFWAGRALMVIGEPVKAGVYFNQAAGHSRTFYGLLARRVIGLHPDLDWETPPMVGDVVERLAGSNYGKRALALVQIDRHADAERELRLMAQGASRETAQGILALATRADMPSLAVRLADKMFPDGGGYDLAAYPLPSWEPEAGFRIDRALIFALIRQESRFNPRAKSYAGARGLMQLMPGTASFVARDRRYRWGMRKELFKPEHNLDLGQKYIEILFDEKPIQGDLFLMTAAWNGGPGNLRKWQRDWRKKNKDGHIKDDPLLFIESIPFKETRDFVEKVLANLWIYRNRLGQDAPSLDALAAGQWPVYTALDDSTYSVANK